MINVIDEYTDFILDEFCFYGKKVMEKYYISSIFNSFVKEYISIRYYNIYPKKQSINSTVNYYLNEKIKELEESNPDKVKSIYFMADIFRYLIALDGDLEAAAVNKIEIELSDLREKKYGLVGKLEFSKEYREFRRRKKDFIKEYETSDFYLELSKTKFKNVLDASLKHSVKMPELYSDKAIEDVYNSGIVSEDKLFVEYNLLAIKILEEIIDYNYDTSYLVEFNTELFNKKEKLNRLLKIIDNDITREKLVLKVSYTSFMDRREEVFGLINDGYSFALLKDENYKEDSYINLFKYVIDKEV